MAQQPSPAIDASAASDAATPPAFPVFISVPPSQLPVPPTESALSQLLSNTADFSELSSELERVQLAGQQLKESTRSGSQLVQNLTARLQRGDAQGANGVLRKIEALPTPQVALGSDIWDDMELRHRLCDFAGVGHFVELYLSSLCFKSFLESGILMPEMPEAWKVGIDDQDDERYLIGLVGGARELERYAVNRAQALDLCSIRICLSACVCLEQVLMQFDFRNGDLRRRFDGIKYCVKRLEHLVYEVDLARQRAAAANDTVVATETVLGDDSRPPVLDLQKLAQIKERYDSFDSMREQVLKRARDVIKGAKNAVYSLQRSDFENAEIGLNQCTKDANDIHAELVKHSPTLRGGIFSASLEEMGEALAYRAFRQEKRLLGHSDLQTLSGLTFKLSCHEYLGALMDLTGEVARLAVRNASRGREAVANAKLCLACVDAVYAGLQELPYLPAGLGKKMGPLKGTLHKIEGVLYELALLSEGGLRVKAPTLHDDGDGDGADAAEVADDDEARAVKRTQQGGRDGKQGKGGSSGKGRGSGKRQES